MGRARIVLSLISVLTLAVSESQALTIADGGPAHANIVVAAGVTNVVRDAADDLAAILSRMSGAEIPIVQTGGTESSVLPAPAIVLGTAAEGLGLKLEKSSRAGDGFRYAVRDGRLLIVGESPQGVYHGVYDFLETLGCGWYTPGNVGEVIPQRKTITVPDDLDHSEISDSIHRRFWYGGGGNRSTGGERSLDAWRRRNKGALILGSWRHAWGGLVPRALFEEHPEYFGVKRGARSTHQLCTTHPDVIRIASETLLDKMRQASDKVVFEAGPNDGGGLCECPDCTKLHTEGYDEPTSGKPCYSDVIFKFANDLAQNTSKTFPDKDLGILVYSEYSRPLVKVEKLHPNVFPMIAPIRRCRLHGPGNPVCPWNLMWEEEIRKWAATSNGKLGFYPYNYNLADALVPFSKIDCYKRLVDVVHDAGIDQLAWTAETMDSWSTHAPHLYLSIRLMWDSRIDIDAEMDRFFKGFYGKAADPMKRYWMRIDEAYATTDTHTGSSYGLHHIWTDGLLADSRADIRKAQTMATGDREQAAVAMAAAGLRCAELFMDIWKAVGRFDFIAADKAQQALQAHIAEQASRSDPPSWLYERYAWGYYKTFVGRTVTGGADVIRNGSRVLVRLPDEWRFKKDEEGAGTDEGWWKPDLDDSDWELFATFSKSWSDQGLPWYQGEAWYRTAFAMPAFDEKADLRLWFGGFDHNVDVYLNGQSLGEQTGFAKPREFGDIAGYCRPQAENVLAVRVSAGGLAELGTGGIMMPVMIYEAHTGDKTTGEKDGKDQGYEM